MHFRFASVSVVALSNIAPCRFAPERFAPVRFALDRFAPVRFAVERFTCDILVYDKSENAKLAPIKSTSTRLLSLNIDLERFEKFSLVVKNAMS